MIDAENIMIPYLRAKFDGDPVHDKITWIMQKETEIGQMVSVPLDNGGYGVKVGPPVEKTFMVGLYEVQGVMFNVKEEIPPMFLITKSQAFKWCDRHHLRFIEALKDQMRTFGNELADNVVQLNRLVWEAKNR
jgi:hypothetical protein